MSKVIIEKVKKKKVPLLIFLFCLLGIVLFLSYTRFTLVRAEEKSWTQDDWSGGTHDEVITTNRTTYLFEENVDAESDVSVAYEEDWSDDYIDWNFRKKNNI